LTREERHEFSVVNSQLETFLQPFIDRDLTPKVWNANLLIWQASIGSGSAPVKIDS